MVLVLKMRIKLAYTTKDQGIMYQKNFQHERNKIGQRTIGRITGTIILRRVMGRAKNMVYVWLILGGR